ncbi:MAG: PQQ-binding-like beta-propeller repeat protein [Pyrinomonadaceae bacterium]|nr:PQQ-binding-like beta-propeller repeat protein [Pyrinomonadaceae bacterium]
MKKAVAGVLLGLLMAGAGAIVGAQGPDQAHWPQWRGPFYNGMARGDAPTVWSETSNIKWKADIPGRGHSTPVIWGDRIFLTTAIPTGKPASAPPAAAGTPEPVNQQGGGQQRRGRDSGPQAEHKFEVLCLDRKTGKLLWQRTAKVAVPHEGYHRAYGSFASNSPVTDGKYVYASFGSRGVYCYDFNGKLIWEKDLGVQMRMRLGFGEGSGPTLVGNRLVLIFDHEADSFIVSLDKRTGKELWRVPRDERSSWSTPLAVQHAGRKQVVVTGTTRVRSYNPENGKVLWESAGLGANAIPVPVDQNGVVYVMSGFRDPRLMAIKLGKEGDLSESDSILWSHTRGLAYTTSPVLHDNRLYVVTDNGLVSVFNATTGEPHYAQVRLPKAYNLKASPVGANGKLYLATEDGDVVVIKLGEKFEVIATNNLEDQVFIATPVIAGGELFLRGQNHLFCISQKSSRIVKDRSHKRLQ